MGARRSYTGPLRREARKKQLKTSAEPGGKRLRPSMRPKDKKPPAGGGFKCLILNGSGSKTRTYDPRINSPLLYQLSYAGVLEGDAKYQRRAGVVNKGEPSNRRGGAFIRGARQPFFSGSGRDGRRDPRGPLRRSRWSRFRHPHGSWPSSGWCAPDGRGR
jgi:hypothetical protein